MSLAPKDLQLGVQIVIEFIEGYAMDFFARNNDGIAPPVKSLPKGRIGNVSITTDDEQHIVLDQWSLETRGICGVSFVVFDPKYPVDELAEAMVITACPFRGRLGT